MIKLVKNELFIYCKEARIESNRSFYGSFSLGPFDAGQSITLANALRRTLLSELKGLAITSAEIEGAFHEYSTLPGVRDSILDILLNLKDIVLKTINLGNKKKGTSYAATFKNEQIGYLKTRGPGIVKAAELRLPPGIQCVDPDQYIATLAEGGVLNIKFKINEGKNYVIKTSKDSDANSHHSLPFIKKVALQLKGEHLTSPPNLRGKGLAKRVVKSSIKTPPSLGLRQGKVVTASPLSPDLGGDGGGFKARGKKPPRIRPPTKGVPIIEALVAPASPGNKPGINKQAPTTSKPSKRTGAAKGATVLIKGLLFDKGLRQKEEGESLEGSFVSPESKKARSQAKNFSGTSIHSLRAIFKNYPINVVREGANKPLCLGEKPPLKSKGWIRWITTRRRRRYGNSVFSGLTLPFKRRSNLAPSSSLKPMEEEAKKETILVKNQPLLYRGYQKRRFWLKKLKLSGFLAKFKRGRVKLLKGPALLKLEELTLTKAPRQRPPLPFTYRPLLALLKKQQSAFFRAAPNLLFCFKKSLRIKIKASLKAKKFVQPFFVGYPPKVGNQQTRNHRRGGGSPLKDKSSRFEAVFITPMAVSFNFFGVLTSPVITGPTQATLAASLFSPRFVAWVGQAGVTQAPPPSRGGVSNKSKFVTKAYPCKTQNLLFLFLKGLYFKKILAPSGPPQAGNQKAHRAADRRVQGAKSCGITEMKAKLAARKRLLRGRREGITALRDLNNEQARIFHPGGGIAASKAVSLAIDSVFMPVNKVNYIIEINEQSVLTKDKKDTYSDPLLTSFSNIGERFLCYPLFVKKPLYNFRVKKSKLRLGMLDGRGYPLLDGSFEAKKEPFFDFIAKRHRLFAPLYLFYPPKNSKVRPHFKGDASPRSNPVTGIKQGQKELPNQSGRWMDRRSTPLKDGVAILRSKEVSRSKNMRLSYNQITTGLKNNILLEIWTNGSIHPRQALYEACKNLLSLFSKLEKATPLALTKLVV